MSMTAVRAHFENGAVVLDEPLDLPDGTPVVVSVPDDAAAFADMDPEERAEFLRELEASCAEADAGQLIDADEVLASLRS
jgi:uncharacterized protein (DUF2126 family)